MIQYIKKRKELVILAIICFVLIGFFTKRAENKRDQFVVECTAKGGQPVRLGFEHHMPVCAKVEIVK